MKKQKILCCALLVLLCISLLAGCKDDPVVATESNLETIAPVGQVPDDFQAIIQKNLFRDVVVFDSCLLKDEIVYSDMEYGDVTHRVQMLDFYGKVLAEFSCSTEFAYRRSTLTATDDGGFLVVLGFVDYYTENGGRSDAGFASRVIKCDQKGNVQFDVLLDSVDADGLAHCFEKDGQFYFFGASETPETKIEGVRSRTDVIMMVLDSSGTVLDKQFLAGSDYDDLEMAELSDDQFVLSISSQSDDGDFAGSRSEGYPVSWVFTVNDRLEITQKERAGGRDFSDVCIGVKDGRPIYRNDPLLDSFEAGTPSALIDYGDFYLIVSSRHTGIYENKPSYISSIWYYTETVYSAYDDSGKLLFRATVDSTPDYDAAVEIFEQEMNN